MNQPRLAVICNHDYPDMQEFFRGKATLKSTRIGERLMFLTNYFAPKGTSVSRIPASFSRKPFFDPYLLLDLLWSPVLAAFLLVKGVRYIHFTTAHSSNLPLALLARIGGVRSVFTIHRLDLDSYDRTRRVLLKMYERLVFALATKIVILSESDRVPIDKKVVLPLAGYRQHRHVPKTTGDYCLFFGRIDEYKGLEDLVDCARRLPNERFVVAGKGDHPALAALQDLPNVRVLNRFISDSEMAELFDGAAMTLLPYKSATQSAVQILSYSFATPIVAYDVGQLASFMNAGETGILVHSCDVDGLVDAIVRLRSESLSAYSQRCIDYFGANFSVDVIRRQYAHFYTRLLVGDHHLGQQQPEPAAP